jgi:hypothetical protein
VGARERMARKLCTPRGADRIARELPHDREDDSELDMHTGAVRCGHAGTSIPPYRQSVFDGEQIVLAGLVTELPARRSRVGAP